MMELGKRAKRQRRVILASLRADGDPLGFEPFSDPQIMVSCSSVIRAANALKRLVGVLDGEREPTDGEIDRAVAAARAAL